MRLRLDDLGPTLAPTAQAEQPDGTLVFTAAPLTIVLSPLTPLPDPGSEPVPLTQGPLGRDCPPGSSVRVVKQDTGETLLGWPVRLVHAQVVGEGDRVVQERLAAIYQFLRYTATALVCGPPDVRLTTPRLIQVLLSGRPDWRGGADDLVAALSDIWR